MEQPAAEVTMEQRRADSEPRHASTREARVRYLALLACINSVSLGYQIGAVTVSNGLVKRHLNLSNAQLAAYEASVNIAAIAGAILSGLISEELGRKQRLPPLRLCLQRWGIVQALSWTYASLLVGILLVGWAWALDWPSTRCISRRSRRRAGRGFFVTYSEAAISAGQLLGYVIALIIDASMGSCACAWRLMLGLGVVPAACLAYAVIFIMPESPRWLARHGREEEARKVLEDDLQWDATRAQAILEDARGGRAQAPQAGAGRPGLVLFITFGEDETGSAKNAVGRRRHGRRAATERNGRFVLQLREGRRRRRLLAAVERSTLLWSGLARKLITAFASMYLLGTVGTCVEIKFWAPHAIDAMLYLFVCVSRHRR